jgi:hypothetical protein
MKLTQKLHSPSDDVNCEASGFMMLSSTRVPPTENMVPDDLLEMMGKPGTVSTGSVHEAVVGVADWTRMSLGHAKRPTMCNVKFAVATHGPSILPDARLHDVRSSATITRPRRVNGFCTRTRAAVGETIPNSSMISNGSVELSSVKENETGRDDVTEIRASGPICIMKGNIHE